MTSDLEYMARALQLARRGLMTTQPNPRVGCVLVKHDVIIGEGWHERAGGPHAEVMALQNAAAEADGATAYVTLEPCSHQGRTPPCADALIKAGVKRVVAAMTDPNPLVAGQGLAALEAAGIKTEQGLLRTEAERLNRGFCKRMTVGRPWVTVKLATSLDGRSAAADGSSQWITSAEAREDVHRRRAEAGAVLTGIASVLADDSKLNVRLEGVETRVPDRIVLDSALRMPLDATMLSLQGRTIILTCSGDAAKTEALQNKGADVVQLPDVASRLDLHAVLDWLGSQQINEVLVEAGPTLAGAFLQAGIADELLCYIAPRLLGDAGQGLLSLPGVKNISQSLALDITDLRAVGPDWRVTASLSDG